MQDQLQKTLRCFRPLTLVAVLLSVALATGCKVKRAVPTPRPTATATPIAESPAACRPEDCEDCAPCEDFDLSAFPSPEAMTSSLRAEGYSDDEIEQVLTLAADLGDVDHVSVCFPIAIPIPPIGPTFAPTVVPEITPTAVPILIR